MKKIVIMGLASGLLSVSGCAIQNQNDEDTTEAVNKTVDFYNNNRVQEPDSLVNKTDNLYISKDVYKIIKEKPLPSAFNETLVYTSAAGDSFEKTVSNLAKLTGIQMKVAAGAQAFLDAGGNPQVALVRYQGTVRQVLDLLVDKVGLYWSCENGKVQIYAMETKIYSLDAPVGAFTEKNTISSSAETSGGGSGGTVEGESSMDLSYDMQTSSPWEASVDTMTSMLSLDGRLTDNPAAGYITVTDNPIVQANVERYIEKINDKSNQKIAIRIDVYDVETSSSSNFGFDMNTLTQILSDDVSIVNATTGFLNDAYAGDSTTITYSSGDHDVVLQALNTIGKASEVTGATVYTISGQPAPVQSVEQQSYLESIEQTMNDNQSTTSLTPGTVVTGYNMMITPRLQSNNQIYVNLNLQISTLLGIDTFGPTASTEDGGTSTEIQLPHIRSKNFLESMILHSGQSIVIAGFQSAINNSSTASPTSTDMWYASGGAKSTEKVINTTVIVITPYIIGD